MKTLYFCQKFEINQQSFFMIKSILFFIHLDPDTAYDKRPLCQKPKVMSWSMYLSIRLLLNVLQTFDKIKCFYEILLIFVTLTFEPCLVLGLLPTAPSWRGRPFCRFTGEGTAWDGVQKRTGRIERSLKMSASRTCSCRANPTTFLFPRNLDGWVWDDEEPIRAATFLTPTNCSYWCFITTDKVWEVSKTC